MPPISAPCGSGTAANRSRPSWMPVAAKLNLVISSRSWSTAELTGWSTTMIRGLLTGRSVLEDPAEVAKSDGGVDAFGHRRRLQARGAAAAAGGVVGEQRGDRGAQAAAAGALEGADVVDAAVAGEVESQPGDHRLALPPREEHVEGGGLRAFEDPPRRAGEVKMLDICRPAGRGEVHLGTRHAQVAERHAHRARRLLDAVAAGLEVGAQRRIGPVDPR